MKRRARQPDDVRIASKGPKLRPERAPRSDGGKTKLEISISSEVRRALAELAKRTGTTLSGAVELLVRENQEPPGSFDVHLRHGRYSWRMGADGIGEAFRTAKKAHAAGHVVLQITRARKR